MNQPTVINNRYQVTAQLGAGSLAIVYRCRDKEQHEQEVAVKVLFPEIAKDARAVSRIRRDYTHLKMLSCPNVIRPFDLFEDDLAVGYSMELANGGDLARKIEEQLPMPIVDAVNILQGVCCGVQAAHNLKLIHRNIKPENLLLMGDGVVKVADFCCSKQEGSQNADDSCAGSLDYVPPEYMANGAIDWRTDIYALGLLGYELVTGQSPFRGKTVLETMTARMESNPAPLTSIRGDCPALLNAIVLRAMHREPEQRFQSANEMLSELQKVG